ncbi:MAG: hypothetical protein ACR2LT_05805 [Pyrinomonadaceae bacterium]
MPKKSKQPKTDDKFASKRKESDYVETYRSIKESEFKSTAFGKKMKKLGDRAFS